jgi:hypothetical protein
MLTMPTGDVETFHEGGEWHNRVEGEGGLRGTHDGKEEAVSEGRRMAQERQVEHIIKNMDGTIGEKNNYGHDPRNVPG